jgi:WD40 repeat protein
MRRILSITWLTAVLGAFPSIGAGALPAAAIGQGSTLNTAPHWVGIYTGCGDDIAYSVAPSPDGSQVFVTGSSSCIFGSFAVTVAYDSTSGAERWAASWDGPDHLGAGAFSVVASPDASRVYVTGNTTLANGTAVVGTVAYDASEGTLLWSTVSATQYGGDAKDIAITPDGKWLFVSATVTNPTGGLDYGVVAYRASDGHRLWSARYDGPVHGQDYVSALAASPDGKRVFVTGFSDGPIHVHHQDDFATVAYDAHFGRTLWAARYDGPIHYEDNAYSVAVSSDGARVYVTGASSGTTSDYATVAYDAVSGMQLGLARDDSGGFDVAFSVAISPDGRSVYVTGRSDVGGLTVAHNAALTHQGWTAAYPALSANAVGVSPDGSGVFITGTGGTGFPDYVTVGYDAHAGGELWAAVWDGPDHGPDNAFALAVSPDGTQVYVTGGTGISNDYATIAYGT